jgi:hypothetical protein
MVLSHLAIFKLPAWVLKRIEKIMRSFLWMKPGATPGARPHSLVNWRTVCRPKELGGLGVLDLERFGRAMRLRWLWYAWTDPARPWVGTDHPCDDANMALFRASTVITLGDGGAFLGTTSGARAVRCATSFLISSPSPLEKGERCKRRSTSKIGSGLLHALRPWRSCSSSLRFRQSWRGWYCSYTRS